MKISLTKFTSRNGLGKFIRLLPDGSLEKEAKIILTKGQFEVQTVAWQDFGPFLDGLRPGEAIGHGVHKTLEQGQVITKAHASTSLLAQQTRTRDNFHFKPKAYNLLMFDLDSSEPFQSLDSAVERLVTLFPCLTQIPGGCWAIASSGANVCNDLEDMTFLSGVHVYFCVPPEIDLNARPLPLREYFTLRGWLNGSSHFLVKKTRCGVTTLERGFIDYATFDQPERLDFIGGSICSPPLAQRREPAVLFDTYDPASRSEFMALFTLTPLETEQARANREQARRLLADEVDEAHQQVVAERRAAGEVISPGLYQEILTESLIPGLLPIQFHDGTQAQAWQLIFWPEKYDKKYCADPLYPEKGTQKAMFYYNRDADRTHRFIISSFVGGGALYRLRVDVDGVREMLRKTDQEEVSTQLKTNPSWAAELNELDFGVELPEILKIIKDKRILDKTEVLTKLGANKKPDLQTRETAILERMNERFAYVTISGKARYVEDTGKEMIIRTRNDFLADVEDWPRVEVWSGARPTYHPAGDRWLQWDGRRKYPGGMRFEPAQQGREFIDQDSGLLVLNRYRGLATLPRPCAERPCGGQRCEGRGCINYFFADPSNGICPEPGTWTYWVKTLYDVACDRNIDHTRWVVDWFADLIQAPGGRGVDGKRSVVALCMRGGQGTGKNSMVEPIMRLLEPHTFTVTDMQRITGNFNKFMEDTLLLFANEAIWGGSRKEGNKLKAIVSDDVLDIEYKGLDTFKARNWIRLYIASNSDWVIPAEHDERRYSVFDVTNAHQKDQKWFARMKAGNLSDLLHDLLELEIKSDIYRNLETDALEDQKAFNRSLVEDFLEYAVEERLFWDRDGVGVPVVHRHLEEIFQERYASRRYYAETPETFKRTLRKRFKMAGFQLRDKVRVSNTSVNGFMMPDLNQVVTTWPWLKKAAASLEDG